MSAGRLTPVRAGLVLATWPTRRRQLEPCARAGWCTDAARHGGSEGAVAARLLSAAATPRRFLPKDVRRSGARLGHPELAVFLNCCRGAPFAQGAGPALASRWMGALSRARGAVCRCGACCVLGWASGPSRSGRSRLAARRRALSRPPNASWWMGARPTRGLGWPVRARETECQRVVCGAGVPEPRRCSWSAGVVICGVRARIAVVWCPRHNVLLQHTKLGRSDA